MIITETGVLVSTDPELKNPAPVDFKIEGGDVGDNAVRATGLTANTTYYAQSYFKRDGMVIRQKGVTEFKTAAQEEVLKIKNVSGAQNSITIVTYGAPPTIEFEYSLNRGETWITAGGWGGQIEAGGEVWFKGNIYKFSKDSSNYRYFSSTGAIACDGNLTALLRKDTTVVPDYCFYRLFYNCSNLITPPDLPAMPIMDYAYSGMFYGCTSMTTAPVLPATKLSNRCYDSMFYGCTSLTSVPSLPATDIATYCYASMFRGCTALTSVPNNLLSATDLNGKTNCYYQMFYGCTSLTNAPDLPATDLYLANNCYDSMFYNCTSLTQAPTLPATTLANSCYASMFRNTAITTAPSLPATTVYQQSYNGMFQGCTALTTAPSLPATTLAQSCYYGMFNSCTSLTQAPSLPATTLAQSCYNSMFYSCTSLTQAPSLPATTLAQSCYQNMFYGCTSLTTAPILYGTTPVSSCYSGMFRNCSSLNRIVCYATTWNTSYASNWVQSVAAAGDFYNLGGANIPIDNNSGVPIGWTLHTTLADYLTLTNTANGQNTIRITRTGNPNITLDYTTDNGSTWTTWTSSTDLSITLNANGAVKFKGTNATFNGWSDYIKFNSSGTCSVSGDINTLLNEVGGDITLPSFAFDHLFENMTDLINGGIVLPSTTLSTYCYYRMFTGCTSIASVPSLPATTLAQSCYSMMFNDCTGLTTVPSNLLPATTMASHCYYRMFSGCTSLTTLPNLPATTLADYCYSGMFYYTAITSVPNNYLPATNLSMGCYEEMFRECTSLTTVPSNLLPATTLAPQCYFLMFETSGITAAPNLPATTLATQCYEEMFKYCDHLTTAPASLPATTLAQSCYSGMFEGDIILANAPVLYGTTMATECYKKMFWGCRLINRIETYITTWNTANAEDWVWYVAATGDFYNIGGATISTGDSGIPSGWTVHTSL